MTIDDAKQVVLDAATIRIPIWDASSPLGPREKVERLENHMLQCSHHRAALEEADLHVSSAVHGLKLKWDTMDGYEGWLGEVTPAKATGPQHERAKRLHDPELWEGLQDGKHWLDRIARQIRRLEKDEEVASRAYTMLTGG